ncbi:alpha/beta hydrolase [Actinospica sp. MGRD01-02]|uniref:Alpha/beta hydrolase n=1 Tax=Actinospica acidithermotolerans TaxID=2828514 RepID=A0A941EBN0_9ACTN|nr:alpha/beta hydrolase [Actinospica acidithermotolerans]MBR7828302.1 alpha/beta hydrolase [Actinospica acidithermotolerans]
MSASGPTPTTPTTRPAPQRADYLALLLAALPADVRQRLEEIGEVTIDETNLAAMRGRTLRSSGTPTGTVEHLNRHAPGDPDVAVRLHRERGTTLPRPCLISIHGGGYVIGSHLGEDGRFDRWCTTLACVGISVGYRLAPETPYPGPLEDCYTALRWAHRNAPELGIDPTRIGVIGGSAGGGLAAGLTLLARDRGEIPISFQVLNYPMLDDRLPAESSRAGAPLWGPATNQYGWHSYLGPYRSAPDVPGYAVPARARDLTGLPPAFVSVGNLDGLLDEDLEYARRLIAAGVPTDLHVFADGPHAFDSMLPEAAITARARRTLEDWLQARMHPRPHSHDSE